jgi:uncharacterized protein YjbK
MLLSKNTQLLWIENEEPFWRILRNVSKLVKIRGEFDDKIGEYLLEKSRYLHYKLEIEIKTKEGAQSLLKFINQIEDSHISNFGSAFLKRI